MAKLRLALLSLAFLAAVSAVQKRDHNDYTVRPHRLVCYFGSWANYHEKEPFLIEDVNTDLCTHINYGFAKIDEYNYTIQPFDPYLDTEWDTWDLKGYERFNELRKSHPQLTTMISLGGWYEGSEKYSDMANDVTLRRRFVQSVVDFLRIYDFDGLDLDWEYPANRLGKPYDKENYITLLSELRDAFDPYGFLLTAALSPGKPTIDKAYDREAIAKINDLLDWGNIMTYDYHGGWENNLGHNAPLYKRSDELDELHVTFNINYTIHYYLQLGMKKEKMVMGMPFYGRAWTLESPDKVRLNDPAKGMSPAGDISGQEGVLGYNELCLAEMDNPGQWQNKYDLWYKAPYAYNKSIWIGYDNQDSLSCKIAFLKEMGLSGGMVWSLENDDFKGRCGGGVYPLLKTVHSMLNGEKKLSFECNIDNPPTEPPTTPTTIPTTPTTPSPTTPTTPSPTTPTTPSPTTPTTPPTTPTTPTTPSPTTPTTPTTPSPTTPTTEAPTTQPIPTTTNGMTIIDDEIHCKKAGRYRYPYDSRKYIECEYVAGGARKGWWAFIRDCAPGTEWDESLRSCA